MEIFIILALILLNGLLAMSEIALISVKKSRLENHARQGSKTARLALRLAAEPDKFLSTVQIGITIIGILTGIYSGSVIADDFSTLLIGWGMGTKMAHPVAQIVIVVTVTYLTLIVGELVPKRIGMTSSERAARFVARPMYLLSLIASPFVWLLAKSTRGVFNLLGLSASGEKVTEEEIRAMVEESAKDGEIREIEQDIVERVFLLGDQKIKSIMTHRSDLVALDISLTASEIREVLSRHVHDLYPVVEKNIDNVVGVVTIKDLVLSLNAPDFSLENVMREAQYFLENMSVYAVLERFREGRISAALICDEFGSCQGIITLRDILEGLVGNIDNQHEEPEIIKRSGTDSGWLVDGQCSFYDFLVYFDKEELFTPRGFSTVGGLVLEQLEHVPVSGEKIEWNDFTLEVVDMDGARIDKLLITQKS